MKASQFWQHRPGHGAPAICEGERFGGVALDKALDQHGGHRLAGHASVKPIGVARGAQVAQAEDWDRSARVARLRRAWRR